MEELIVYNTTNDFLYLKIPDEYSCVYNKLLNSLSSLGLKGLLDCKGLSLPCNNIKNIIDSWNMFQISCAAYELGEVDKADTIINFINKKMKYCCPVIVRKYSKIVYYGDNYGEPTVEEILAGESVDFFIDPIFTSPFFKDTQYIAIPEGILIDYVENASIAGAWLYNSQTTDDEYTKKKIVINEEIYDLWYVTYPEPLDTNIIIHLMEGNWQAEGTVYYNQVNEHPTTAIILAGNKFDLSTGKILMTSIYKVGHYFAVPSGFRVKTIRNASFNGDWLYNIDLSIDLYTRENIILNNKSYVLWYCEFAIPLNASLEVIFDI